MSYSITIQFECKTDQNNENSVLDSRNYPTLKSDKQIDEIDILFLAPINVHIHQMCDSHKHDETENHNPH